MNKFFVISFNIIIMLINEGIIIAEYTNPPRRISVSDYILRSCVASVVLFKNHKSSQLLNFKLAKTNQMSASDISSKQKGLLTLTNIGMNQHDTTWHTKQIKSVDTPLKTLDIKKRRMGDLIFTKKEHFPEIFSTHYSDKEKKDTEIIIIKSIHRNDS